MLREILRWKRKLMAEAVPVRLKPEPMSDKAVQRALELYADDIHFPKRSFHTIWQSIPPIHCPVPFGGCGYVEGQRGAAVFDKRIWLVEADSDMEYTYNCILIDGVPSLLTHWRRGRLKVRVLAGQDYFAELFNSTAQPMSNVAEFRALPPAVQAVLETVLKGVLRIHNEKPDAIEKILDYGEGR